MSTSNESTPSDAAATDPLLPETPDHSAQQRPWWRDPFVVFLVLGALLFAFDRWRASSAGSERILISEAEVARLAGLWVAQSGREPTAEELEGLVQATVREEVLFREALRLGLDQDDTIVRRRMAQKMGFLIDDNTRVEAPGEEELEAWFEEQAERYVSPARWSFRHIYYSVDRQGEPAARARAANDLQRLEDREAAADWRTLGDPFMLQREYAARSEQDLAELFGRRFANALEQEGPAHGDAWFGPVRSALGLHLVQIESFTAERQRTLEEARAEVLEDYRRHQRELANEAAYRDLRARYEIQIEMPGGEELTEDDFAKPATGTPGS